MSRFQISQRGTSALYILTILALIALGGVAISKYFVPATAHPLPPVDNLSNIVRGYIAVSVGGPVKVDPGPEISAVGPTSTAASFNRPPARGVAPKDIYLPGVSIYLEDPLTQKRSNVGRTDLSGRFTLYAPEPSQYRICWESAVYGNGCTEVFVNAGSSPQFLSTVHITTPTRQDFVAMTGHVTMNDGSLPRAFDPMLNINAFATVGLDDEKGQRVVSVYVNDFGDYLLPYVPVRQKVKLSASIEGAKFTQEIGPDAHIESSALHQIDLRIANSRPLLDPLLPADSNNRRVQNAVPGSEIRIAARTRDSDGDVVKFAWFVDPTAGQLSQTSGSSVKWRLPQTPGLYPITVVAYDGKGGYDKTVLSVPVGLKGVPFSGIVVGQDGAPIDQAEIEVVGHPIVVANPIIKTAPNGRFSTYVTEADRYVFNVRKEGYALNSQIYDREQTSGRWILRRGQVKTIDPTRDQTVTNERTQGDCPGPDGARAGFGVAGDSLKEPQWQDGGGHVIDPPSTVCKTCTGPVGKESEVFVSKRDRSRIIMPRDLKLPKCGPGVSVEIPANSILDASGMPATAPVAVTIATVDLLSPQQMPGDDSVVPIGGGGRYLKSFGAGSLNLPSGFKLKPGAVAKVTIPVDRARLKGSSLAPTAPLLSYDEQKGLWLEEGVLTLSAENGVQAYVGDVKHFSDFNADTFFEKAACVRVISSEITGNYDLEVISPYPDGTPHYKKYAIDNVFLQEHVIFNITPNANITLAPMTQEANPQLLGFYIVNSGPPQDPPNSPDVPPLTPLGYTSCRNFVVLKSGAAAPDSPFGGEFLHGLGFINGLNLGFDDLTAAPPSEDTLRNAIVAASRKYYETVDPGSATLDTLVKFKLKYGFAPDPNAPNPGETVVSYANSGDLGFGRDMHCKNNGLDIGCYVTNYGTGYNNSYPGGGTSDQNDANAAASATDILTGVSRVGFSGSLVGATVAMEYAQINGVDPRVVKFFVYKNNVRSISANLDGRGERPVPQLCMICHGGQIPEQPSGTPIFNTPAQVTFNSRFIPFDYRFFTFPTTPLGLTKVDQDANFKSLNEQFVAAVPTSPLSNPDPIGEVISAMYSGNSLTQLPDTPVAGWATGGPSEVPGQQLFYQRVVAPTCRICHASQSFEQLQFNTSAKFLDLSVFNAGTLGGAQNRLMLGTAQKRVCGDYAMPHALRTHEIFWGYSDPLLGLPPSPTMSAAFQTFGDGVPTNGTFTWKPGLCTFTSTLGSSPGPFFDQVIQPIFNAKCSGCHHLPIPNGSGAPFSLTQNESYNSLLGLASTFPFLSIARGSDNAADPDNRLLKKVTADVRLQRMPPNCFRPTEPQNGALPCLSQLDIEKIKVWLRNGGN